MEKKRWPGFCGVGGSGGVGIGVEDGWVEGEEREKGGREEEREKGGRRGYGVESRPEREGGVCGRGHSLTGVN